MYLRGRLEDAPAVAMCVAAWYAAGMDVAFHVDFLKLASGVVFALGMLILVAWVISTPRK